MVLEGVSLSTPETGPAPPAPFAPCPGGVLGVVEGSGVAFEVAGVPKEERKANHASHPGAIISGPRYTGRGRSSLYGARSGRSAHLR